MLFRSKKVLSDLVESYLQTINVIIEDPSKQPILFSRLFVDAIKYKLQPIFSYFKEHHLAVERPKSVALAQLLHAPDLRNRSETMPWRDIARDQQFADLQQEFADDEASESLAEAICELYRMIEHYHLVPKSDAANLLERVELLTTIANHKIGRASCRERV